MQVIVDGSANACWALQDIRTGVIDTTTVCETEAQAIALRRARQARQAHLPDCRVVPITLSVILNKG